MLRTFLSSVLTLPLLFISPSSIPAQHKAPKTDDELGMVERQIAKLDPAQDFISNKVVGLGHLLDSFLGEDEAVLDTPGSLLKLQTGSTTSERGTTADINLQMKLELPHTERRLSLLVESEGETDVKNGDGKQSSPLEKDGNDELQRNLFTLALRAVFFPFFNWDLSTDAGIRVETPPDAFARLRFRRTFKLDGWSLRFKETGFWFNSIGSGASSEFRLQRSLSSHFNLSANTRATWLHEAQQFFYSQDVLLAQTYNRRVSLGYNLGIRGESEPIERITYYFANVHWRRRIHRDWLYFEIIPQVAFDESHNFEADPTLTLELEALFGDTSN